MAATPVSRLTEDEYLEFDQTCEFRNEFIDGEMLAMSGVSPQHTDLQGNIYFELRGRLRGRCHVYNAGLRVKVSHQMYAYPDVFVVCGRLVLAEQQRNSALNPMVLFEILSPSTERYDRGVKFQHYRTIESLKDYILVSQDQVRIEHYTRKADNTWTLRDSTGPEAELNIDSLGVSVSLSAIYEGVELEPTEAVLPAAAAAPEPGN